MRQSRCFLALVILVGLLGSQRPITPAVAPGIDASDDTPTFTGSKGGDKRQLAGIKLCWCPPGRFQMGSPPDEPERRSDEAQVDVTLTKGFWLGKYEATQGQSKRVVGKRYACIKAQGDQQLTCLSVGR
jgi:formylglycine-generating enzyme required for sulfatase activity